MVVLLGCALVLYIFGIFGFMQFGYILIALACAVCLIYCLINLRESLKVIFSVPMIILYIMLAGSLLLNTEFATSDPQVTSYWLPGLQYIISTGKLPYSADAVLPPDILHPPLLWLLQYLMLFSSESISLSVVYACNNLLAFACMLPLFGDEQPRDRYDYVLIAVKFVLIYGLLGTGSGLTTLEPGRLFALLFGYGIYVALTHPCHERFELTEISCILSGVMLLNSTGFAFAFVILLVARVMAFFNTKGGLIKRIFSAAKEHFMATIVLTATSFSFVLLLFLSDSTSPESAVSSVLDALDDFLYWFPYTLTVLSILLLPSLVERVQESKKLRF